MRILVAVVGIPLLLLVFIAAPSWATMILVGGMCCIGAHELMHVTGEECGKRLAPLAAMVAAAIPVGIYMEAVEQQEGRVPFVPVSVLVLIGACFLLGLFAIAVLSYGGENAVTFHSVNGAIFSGLVFPLMLSCLLRLRLDAEMGKVLVFVPLCICFGTDTFAYFVGRWIGRHKLSPKVSPHKTVEGAVGGLFGGVFGMVLLHLIASAALDRSFLDITSILVLGLVGSVVAQLGDLSFSFIKREFQVKDYGKLLPGHGGIVDRFDSVTFVAPMIWILCSFL